MAFVNANGGSISFECSDLIEELKEDIAEFGGEEIVAVWCRNVRELPFILIMILLKKISL